MCIHLPALLAFSKLLYGWEFCAIDVVGLSGGLLTGWNPHSVRCKVFETIAGILVNARFHGSPTSFSILNCYGPYSNREAF